MCRVISGVRLVKKNGIIHLTAVERTLLPGNKLNEATSNVVSNSNFTVNDGNVSNGVDYFRLTYEYRTLNLDTIVGHRDQLLTGVRLAVIENRLQLQARFTYYDELTGKLDQQTASEWKSLPNGDREKVSLTHAALPTKASEQSKMVNGSGVHFVEVGAFDKKMFSCFLPVFLVSFY